MKAIITLTAIFSVLLFSCSVEPVEQDLEANREYDTNVVETLASPDLMAGQHIDTGSVTVTLDGENISITYQTEGDWVILETHLFVGPESDLPTNGGGNPRIGHFPYGDSYPGGTNEVSFEDIVNLQPNECMMVAAHAVVVNTVTGQQETAWGAGQQINNHGGSWAMMFEVCNDGAF